MDGGCSFIDYKHFKNSSNILLNKCELLNSDRFIAININGMKNNIKIQIRKELLNDLELINDTYFLNDFPHYQSGIILLYKCEKSIQFVKDWYNMYNLYYKDVNFKRRDKRNQFKYFYGNNVDQGFMQILLYKNKINILDFQEYKKYTKRIRH